MPRRKLTPEDAALSDLVRYFVHHVGHYSYGELAAAVVTYNQKPSSEGPKRIVLSSCRSTFQNLVKPGSTKIAGAELAAEILIACAAAYYLEGARFYSIDDLQQLARSHGFFPAEPLDDATLQGGTPPVG